VFGGLALLRGGRLTRILIVLVAAILFLSPIRDLLAQQDWVTSHDLSIESRFGLLDSAGKAVTYLADQPLSFVVGIGYGQWEFLGKSSAVSGFASGPVLALHNTFITLFLEDGPLATVPYVAILVLALATAWAHRSD